MRLDARTTAVASVLGAVLAALLLTGCGPDKSETLAAVPASNQGNLSNTKNETSAAGLTSRPGDVIGAEATGLTSEIPSCEGVAALKITVTDGIGNSGQRSVATTTGKPVKLSITTLEPIRVQLLGSQFTLVHTQRGVNLLCLVYATPGKYNVVTGENTALVIEVGAGK